MRQLSTFDAGHDDLIHDIVYDYYGTKLITVSSDQRIKVWETDEGGAWVLNDAWKAHDSSVVKASWAHPEFGQVFASCSFDRTIKVWEEQEQEQRHGGRRWAERATLTESRGSVHDIEFAPNHLGLKLATSGADGILRIYEAMDVVNLSAWTLMEEFEIVSGGSKESDGIYCLSWCQSRMEPQMLVVGCGRENSAKIYRIDSHGKWMPFEALFGHGDTVCDVAWAPTMGRNYHLIATACKDGHVRIFKLTEDTTRPGAVVPHGLQSRKQFRVYMVADFDSNGSEAWRVEWNITGTILSSSSDDGKVRLWKASYLNDWKLISTICAEQTDATSTAK
ncbi:hypothetical protein BASA50_007895 [Batrachochytrium salamandrivorans]|uniref:Anaphase-promoting complex subunit 4 WD40 domain-containing protein n=1 Tax=Batrachochytrium salamandrivorans TaxID=1357716 RepID=A0ABQ8F5P6_9FUNG|nr:hypothetical protein BASA62_003005 [Batrachochytrium salamandrivorans]KAH6581679.1 hypothetical protein BASA60_002266 [Batrachochytrium salamandrivorans]KAH6592715.1 hypothetical protein BASA50_007895 [Batrachochytrium salamandrivorans]KAH6602349.1 hypothetical protein BASA61_001223 [Batrachochytrium salamandrivorans]KAH9246392.1 hypothetical protein BASA81_016056 [Batrachochytrium salamandrivorans]